MRLTRGLRPAGTIPSAWSALPLTYLDVSSNAVVGACGSAAWAHTLTCGACLQ